MMQAPNVLFYADLKKFLLDYYNFRKFTSGDFSYEVWSQELNFSSRSYVRMVVLAKRKASKKFEQKFSESANFSDAEKKHFHLLIIHSRTAAPELKSVYLQKIFQSMNHPNGSADFNKIEKNCFFVNLNSEEKNQINKDISYFIEEKINKLSSEESENRSLYKIEFTYQGV